MDRGPKVGLSPADPRQRAAHAELTTSGEALEIRRARASEREPLAALWSELIEHHRRLSGDGPPATQLREAVLKEIQRGLTRETCRLLVATRGERIIGFTFAEIERGGGVGQAHGPAWIHELFVVAAERRRGAGAALVAGVEVFFAERGVKRVSVRVEAGNAEGLRFWEKRRFAERARILERAT